GAVANHGVRAYVFGFAKNLVKEGWKAGKREEALDPETANRKPSPGRDIDAVNAKVLLGQLLGRLSEEDRELIVRYCKEDDHSAHCRDLGVSPGNLRVMVHRIREKLRAMKDNPF